MGLDLPEETRLLSVLSGFAPNLILVALFIGLALVRKPWFHAIAVPSLIVYHPIIEWSGRVLSALWLENCIRDGDTSDERSQGVSGMEQTSDQTSIVFVQ